MRQLRSESQVVTHCFTSNSVDISSDNCPCGLLVFQRSFALQARQEVFLAASRRRRSKRAYNRVDREMKEKYQKCRVAGMCSGTTAARATAPESASTSSKPALPTASVVSHKVRAPGATWQGLATLRTGPSTCQKLTKKKAPTGT